MPRNDAQLAEARDLQIDEIARAFGVPRHLLRDEPGAADDDWINDAMLWWLATMEADPWQQEEGSANGP